jgi:glycosyltransferase involved in cell wall biosynthesis
MMARAGWRVRALGSTASESHDPATGMRTLEQLGIARSGCPVLAFSHNGVDYRLLDTGPATVNEARVRHASDFDQLLHEALAAGRPDIVLTYGSSHAEVARRARARKLGSRVVFSVHNFAYREPHAFSEVDVILTPTRAVSDHYRASHHVNSISLRMAIDPTDVLAPVREPAFYTFVNPTKMKGVHLFVRLLQRSRQQIPDAMFLVVESRGSSQHLSQAAAECGVDLTQLTNFRIVRNTPKPANVFAVTRVLLVPSLMEAGARIAAEAMINGIPVIGSDQGGTPETVAEGGIILPAGEDNVDQWADAIATLHHNEPLYRKLAQAAAEATADYRNGTAEKERVALFRATASTLSSTP